MRQKLILTIATIFFLSCNSADVAKFESNTISERQQTGTTENKTEREKLIEKLKTLQAVFASDNKQKIADIFSFPISNETVGIYIDDSIYNAQYEKNGNRTTRTMFIKHYRGISEILQIDQINQLFKKLNIDNLLHKDTLEYEAIIKTEPCYHFYGIKIDKDRVTLTVGTNSNKDYKSKSVSEDEIPENDSSICEHILWWVFIFDGKQLHFKEISGAG